MQYFHNTHIDFIGPRFKFFIFSVILFVFGLFSMFVIKPEYGIDFSGGSEVAVGFNSALHTDQIRNVLNKTPLAGPEIKSYGQANQFLIRIKETGTGPDIVKQSLTKAFPDKNMTILKVDKIGPKIGAELRTYALIAVILSIVAILLYLAFRFEFVYGLGASVALFHDIIISMGIAFLVHKLGIINLEVNQSFLAAMLTVLGYSVNDTVIIFDRIRENRELHKGMNFLKLCNLSINETLTRTVNTVATVVLVLLTLLFLGGPVLEGFAFIMLLGILFGTYSSVYIASAFVIWYMQKKGKIDHEGNFLAEKEKTPAAKMVKA